MSNFQSSFRTFDLTQEEFTAGSMLNHLQEKCLQNQIAQLAEQKLALKYTPDSPLTFLQAEAELQGSINALRYLFTLSENAKTSANNLQEF